MSQRIAQRAAVAATVVMFAAVGAVSAASPAAAAKASVSMTFDAAPEPVMEGGAITLAGRAWRGATGNAGKVEFWFRRANRTGYSYVTSTTTGPYGYFRKSVRATATGVWKAVYLGNSKRLPASRFDAAQVLGYRNRTGAITVFSRSGSGDYAGSVRSIGAGQITVTYSNACASSSPFLLFSWNGSPVFDYDSIWVDGAYVSGTQYLHPDEATGYFSVGSQDSCSWSITATQYGTARVRVQV